MNLRPPGLDGSHADPHRVILDAVLSAVQGGPNGSMRGVREDERKSEGRKTRHHKEGHGGNRVQRECEHLDGVRGMAPVGAAFMNGERGLPLGGGRHRAEGSMATARTPRSASAEVVWK